MKTLPIEDLAALRVVVGYLGERERHGWWQSSFFSPTSYAFLVPTFPRTADVARCTGVAQAASRLHDDRIGIGRVYHLFRLPEDMEQSLHRCFHQSTLWARIKELVNSPDQAMAYLQRIGLPTVDAGRGPLRIGNLNRVRNSEDWARIAALYRQAFESNTQVYPFFSDTTS